jgi:hypothetical protein
MVLQHTLLIALIIALGGTIFVLLRNDRKREKEATAQREALLCLCRILVEQGDLLARTQRSESDAQSIIVFLIALLSYAENNLALRTKELDERTRRAAALKRELKQTSGDAAENSELLRFFMDKARYLEVQVRNHENAEELMRTINSILQALIAHFVPVRAGA